MVGMDLFYTNRQNYLVVVVYFPKSFELVPLKKTTTADVIAGLQTMFARYGIPDVVHSDNGPQFTSTEFKRSLTTSTSTHITSSRPNSKSSAGQIT